MRIGVPFVKFGAEVKQYGVDAAAAILLTLVAIEVRERSVSLRRLVAAGALGLLVLWFPQAAVVVMAGIGMAASTGCCRATRTPGACSWSPSRSGPSPRSSGCWPVSAA